jgi:hypothetical protein
MGGNVDGKTDNRKKNVPGMKLEIKHKPREHAAQTPPPSLLNAQGVITDNGTVVWGEITPTALTDAEIKAVRAAGFRPFKAEAVKALMGHKTCAEIVRHFKGRRGFSASTVRHIHAALSKK